MGALKREMSERHEAPHVPMVDGSKTSSTEVLQKQNVEIKVLEQEQALLIQSLQGEKNMRLAVEMELAALKAEYEMQEKVMLNWFLEFVRVSNGEEYLRKLSALKQMRPTSSSTSDN